MEKDYIEIYTKAYQEEEIHHEKYIKKKVLEYHDYLTFNDNNNSLINELDTKLGENIIFDDAFSKITTIFRTSRFRKGHELKIISIKLLPEFLKIDKGNLKVSFEGYLKELARFKAEEEIQRLFCNNRGSYELMFELNDFSEFAIKGCDGGNGSVLYEKYRKLWYEPKKHNEINKLVAFDRSAKFIGLEKTNHYQIKEEYYEKFLSKEFYGYLIKDFINETKTSYSCFKDVFTEKSVKHSSEIHFFCSTILASLLLSEFKKHVFNKLVMTQIEIKHLKVNNGNRLSANNISKSKKNASESHERKVNKALLFLEEILIKPTISDNKC